MSTVTLLPGLLPVTRPMFAVFFNEETGAPYVEPVVCLGVFERNADGIRILAAFTQGIHVEAADFRPNFVSLTENPDVEEWKDRCFEARRKAAEEKAKQKIIVPNQGVVSGAFGNQN